MARNPYYDSSHWDTLRRAALNRDHGLCVVPGCGQRAQVVDHIRTRLPTPQPCSEDVLENLRSLCFQHDAQVKERSRGDGRRKQGGQFKIRGCDVDGRPLDPKRRS